MPWASAVVEVVAVRVRVDVRMGVGWGGQRHGDLHVQGVGAHVGDVAGDATLRGWERGGVIKYW